MSIVGVVSMKGGVGKTTTTANLASAMASMLGPNRVSVLDLDPQNGLRWHFGVDHAGSMGVCELSLRGAGWVPVSTGVEFDVICLPYGDPTEPRRVAFESLLSEHPDWVGAQIEAAGLADDAVLLIDTPPGPSVYLKQVFACADLILVVLLSDAGSYATIPAMEAWAAAMGEVRPGVRMFYLLNQIDRSDPLNRDVADVLLESLGPRLAPIAIHSDEAVGEALATQQPVLLYDPHGQASHDFSRLASWVIDSLNQ